MNFGKLLTHNLASLTIFSGLTAWFYFTKLMALTFITFFMLQGRVNINPKLDEIGEVLLANQLTVSALSVLSFGVLLSLFQPFPASYFKKIINFKDGVLKFLPGALHGSIVAMAILAGFMAFGTYRFVGFLMPQDSAPEFLEGLGVLCFRVLVLLIMIYFEEYFFRLRILKGFCENFSPMVSNLMVSTLYLLLKTIQFDLGYLQSTTVFLVSFCLGFYSIRRNFSFEKGAGYWVSLLVVFQVLFGLPIFGIEYSGIFLLKNSGIPNSGSFYSQFNEILEVERWITGGAGGPLSSLPLQAIVGLEIWRNYSRLKGMKNLR